MPGLHRCPCHHDNNDATLWMLPLLPQHVAPPLDVITKQAKNKHRACAAAAVNTTTSMRPFENATF